jgi:beta-N-acetylhexosaminidase
MKKKFSAVNILLLVLFLICGCSAAEKGNIQSNDTQPSVETWATEHGLRQMASAVTDKLTLEEKIGQMMFVGIHGTTLTETTKNTLSSMHAGGVILFDRNMENREQVKALNASLRNLVLNKYALPLFLSVDQEGGLVTRMKQHAYTAPAAAEIGATGKLEDAYNHANNTGKDIHELGFNLDFAPVLDISSRMHGRSYGTTPQQVTAFGEQACRGLRDSGVLFTVKHFPGMGRSETDPHTDQSVVNVPRQTILQEDLLPFRNIIDQYPHHEFMVMAGHIRYPAFDTKPASLSPVILKQLLRNQLGYQGIVITDDLDMGAVSEGYQPEEIGIIAVQAGTDILLSCHKPEVQQRIYRSTLQAVKDGKISQKDIDASVRRIVYCKLKKLMDNDQRKNCFNRLSGNANVSQHYSPQQPLWSGRSTVRLTPEIQDGKAS